MASRGTGRACPFKNYAKMVDEARFQSVATDIAKNQYNFTREKNLRRNIVHLVTALENDATVEMINLLMRADSTKDYLTVSWEKTWIQKRSPLPCKVL